MPSHPSLLSEVWCSKEGSSFQGHAITFMVIPGSVKEIHTHAGPFVRSQDTVQLGWYKRFGGNIRFKTGAGHPSGAMVSKRFRVPHQFHRGRLSSGGPKKSNRTPAAPRNRLEAIHSGRTDVRVGADVPTSDTRPRRVDHWALCAVGTGRARPEG